MPRWKNIKSVCRNYRVSTPRPASHSSWRLCAYILCSTREASEQGTLSTATREQPLLTAWRPSTVKNKPVKKKKLNENLGLWLKNQENGHQFCVVFLWVQNDLHAIIWWHVEYRSLTKLPTPPKKKIRKQLSLERGAKPFASFEIFCHLKNKNAMQFNQGNFSTKHDEAIGYPKAK